jgi:hypothetical protein
MTEQEKKHQGLEMIEKIVTHFKGPGNDLFAKTIFSLVDSSTNHSWSGVDSLYGCLLQCQEKCGETKGSEILKEVVDFYTMPEYQPPWERGD